MVCARCGATNTDDSVFCGNCGQLLAQRPPQNQPTLLSSAPEAQVDSLPTQTPTPPDIPPHTTIAGRTSWTQPPSSRPPANKTILLVGAALLVLSCGFLVFLATYRGNTIHFIPPPTSTVATKAISTSQNPYFNGGSLVLDDPLRDDSKGYHWTSGTDCLFQGGTFHMRSTGLNYCLASTPASFSNFAYEIQMTLVNGVQGGIVFRANDPNQLYYFDIDIYGVNSLFRGVNNTQPYVELGRHASTAIKKGLNQTNVLAVLVIGNTIDLYVNRQHVARMSDSTYNSGLVGVAVSMDGDNNPTEAVFHNAKVWVV